MKTPPHVRFVSVTGCLVMGQWAAFELLHSLYGRSLPDTASSLIALMQNIISGLFINFLVTGRWIPDVSKSSSATTTPLTGVRGIPGWVAVLIASVAWTGSYFFSKLFADSLAAALSDPGIVGLPVNEIAEMRINATCLGIMLVAVFYPMISVSAFLLGWASRERIGFLGGIVPAATFIVVSFISSSGAEVLKTGVPPSVYAIQMLFRLPEKNPAIGDLGVMWLITVATLVVLALVHACLFTLWAFLGRLFRRLV